MLSLEGKTYYFSWHFMNCIMSLQHNLIEDTEAFSENRWPNSWTEEFEEVSFWSHEALGLVFQQEKISENETNKIDEFLITREDTIFNELKDEIHNIADTMETKFSGQSRDEYIYYAFCLLLHNTLTEFQNLIEQNIPHSSQYWEDYNLVRQNIMEMTDALREDTSNITTSLQSAMIPATSAFACTWYEAVNNAISSYL